MRKPNLSAYLLYVACFHVTVQLTAAHWSNGLGEMLSRSCMYGFGITGLKSEYYHTAEDRQWEVTCSKVGLLRGDDVCRWTYDFVNDEGSRISFQCEKDEYVAGLYSDFNSTAKDRLWRIECCRSPGIQVLDCVKQDWTNKYTEPMDLQLAPKRVIKGLFSVFKQSDRKWRFTTCKAQKQLVEENQQNPAKPNST